ncbi:uncharacterized protein LOC127833372 [Dreissena polymorpha]|uniref:TNF family profile domain-containing protein n=1 Tax=Dreissena polymorpha TaxID=45954 RepID=A0A9D4JG92_DREPO|nr:uncharacterized protein LOC127833372 [Dreissena polymorpha]KAH3810755.1 hypothetical protein DPMN_139152 [Dreissena polymorpha]
MSRIDEMRPVLESHNSVNDAWSCHNVSTKEHLVVNDGWNHTFHGRYNSRRSLLRRILKLTGYITLNVVMTIFVIYGLNRIGFFGMMPDFCKSSVNETNQTGNLPMFQALTESFHGGDTARVGRFVLNATAVYDEKIRWLASSVSSSAGFHASQNDSCVSVPDNGLYHVISQLTFAFKNDTLRTVGHSVIFKQRSTMAEFMIQKKLISLPYRDPTMNVKQRMFIPSNLLVFVEVYAGDWVCAQTSAVDLVYASNIDNVLNIYKL